MSAPSQRNESLDVLRCVAVLLVVGFHLPYYTLWSRIGWIGVDLFFVLSGFLISGLLFQEYKDTGTLSIKRFLIRRGLKIYPSFYLLMVLVTCLYFLDRSTVSTEQLALSWVFLQNYYTGEKIFMLLAHTWSLAVEEHFYLLLPFVADGPDCRVPKARPVSIDSGALSGDCRILPGIPVFDAATVSLGLDDPYAYRQSVCRRSARLFLPLPAERI